MQNVAGKITIGNTALRTGKNSQILAVDVQAAFAVPVHRCLVTLQGRAPAVVKTGAPVRVELGYDQQLSPVFAGQVRSIEAGLTEVRIEALSSFTALTSACLNLLYEKQVAREIVDNVLGRLKIKKGRLEPGVKFGSYALGAGRSAWANLQALAEQCGFDFYADVEDRAVFGAYRPSRVHDFQYGAHILEYTWETHSERYAGVQVQGESPAGQGQSEEASSWLTKKEVKGTAGKTSGSVLRLVDPTARNPSQASAIAGNHWRRSKVLASGRVRVIGAPAVALGDAIRLSRMPVAGHNGVLRVVAVRHRLHPATGFITEVSWEKR